MLIISVSIRLCLLYFLVFSPKGFGNAAEPLSSSSLPSSSCSCSYSPHSFVIQKTTTTKDCSNCVLVQTEALQSLLEMTNVTINDLQPQDPEEPADHHVGDDLPQLPSMEGLSQGLESCNQKLLLAFWESEAKNLQLMKEINKQKEEANKYKEELEREKEEKDQLMRDCHLNPHHHRHPCHHHRPHHRQPPSVPGAHPLSMDSDSTATTMSDLQDIKEVLLDIRDNGRFYHQDIKDSIFDGFMDIRYNGIECKEIEPEEQKKGWPPKDCYDIYEFGGGRESGVYTIHPLRDGSDAQGVRVWCDMREKDGSEGDGGGWTVILQRRQLPQQVLFHRHWSEYKEGFGNPLSEYWIGNEVLHQLTALGKPQKLCIDMEDFDGVRKFASYGRFSVGSEEDNFRLTVGMFSNRSTVNGDSLGYHNSMEFSTYDRDNDQSQAVNCVMTYGGGGFWMKKCHSTNPTAPISGKGNNNKEMVYFGFNNGWTTLKELTMKVKPSG